MWVAVVQGRHREFFLGLREDEALARREAEQRWPGQVTRLYYDPGFPD